MTLSGARAAARLVSIEVDIGLRAESTFGIRFGCFPAQVRQLREWLCLFAAIYVPKTAIPSTTLLAVVGILMPIRASKSAASGSGLPTIRSRV